jgi:hypothetical protein
MPLHGARCRARAFGRADDLGHLGGGAPGHLTLERLGQIEQPLLGHRFARARRRRQRFEAAAPIGTDPAVDGAAGHPDRPSVGPGVIATGQLPHEPTTLADGERLIGRLADEGIAKESDLSLRLVHGSRTSSLSVKR